MATLSFVALAAWLAARGDAAGDPAVEDLDAARAVSRATARAVARVGASVVSVRAFHGKTEDYGAGVVVDSDGLVLTALHVVEGAGALTVRLGDEEHYAARVRSFDEAADLALLEIIGPDRKFQVVRFGREDRVQVGETLLVVGNPFGLGASVTRGILSAKGRTGVVKDNVVPLLQTDAAINPGSSGGALVTLEGEVIGMVNAILTRDGGHQGVGFAVPASELRRAIPFLKRNVPVARAWIGVRVRPEAGRLEVVSLVEEGPAKRAGVKAGDRLVGLSSIDDLRALLRRANVGEPLGLRIERAGRTLDLKVLPE